MTGQARSERRFLGRPEGARPGYVPPADERRRPVVPERSRGSSLWLTQAITGGLLVVFLGVHLMAQHILAPGGLRDFADVQAFLKQPLALISELGLVGAVLIHVVLGIRAFLVEAVKNQKTQARLSWIVAGLGLVAFVYAIWLTATIINYS